MRSRRCVCSFVWLSFRFFLGHWMVYYVVSLFFRSAHFFDIPSSASSTALLLRDSSSLSLSNPARLPHLSVHIRYIDRFYKIRLFRRSFSILRVVSLFFRFLHAHTSLRVIRSFCVRVFAFFEYDYVNEYAAVFRVFFCRSSSGEDADLTFVWSTVGIFGSCVVPNAHDLPYRTIVCMCEYAPHTHSTSIACMCVKSVLRRAHVKPSKPIYRLCTLSERIVNPYMYSILRSAIKKITRIESFMLQQLIEKSRRHSWLTCNSQSKYKPILAFSLIDKICLECNTI